MHFKALEFEIPGDDFHVVPNPAEGMFWDDVEVIPTRYSGASR